MTASPHSRDATATIRGYMYQFDATIRSIINLSDHEQLDIEGIEDFDIGSGDITELFQCKYYAAQRLTRAELRDAILPMLKGFLALDPSSRERRRFHLYGYYKDSSPGQSHLTLHDLKDALVKRKRVQKPGGKTQTESIDLQAELDATDDDLRCFAKNLTIHIGEEYEQHKRRVLGELKDVMGVSKVVAEEHLYPSALSLVANMATGEKPAKRRITKTGFCSKLLPSRTLLSAWLLREMGDYAFCREMRRRHFSRCNLDAVQRVFIVDCTHPVGNAELLSLLHTLRQKWSSHSIRRRLDSERYAPYVYLRGLPDSQLVELKLSLQGEGIGFVDGYAFSGAAFSPAHVAMRQTYANGISLRFLNCQDDLRATLDNLLGERCIYDFFIDSPWTGNVDVRYTAFPVNSISMIERII